MTTKFLDNKICIFKAYCRDVSHEKQRFGRFSSLPRRPHPPENRKFYFYCRLAVSEFRIFFIFSALGRGKGESEAPKRSPGGGGAEGPGGCLRRIGELGKGGLNIFFSGRDAHQEFDSAINLKNLL